MTLRQAQHLGTDGQRLFIGRGRVDLKTHVSAIDLEIDEDAPIRELGVSPIVSAPRPRTARSHADSYDQTEAHHLLPCSSVAPVRF